MTKDDMKKQVFDLVKRSKASTDKGYKALANKIVDEVYKGLNRSQEPDTVGSKREIDLERSRPGVVFFKDAGGPKSVASEPDLMEVD